MVIICCLGSMKLNSVWFSTFMIKVDIDQSLLKSLVYWKVLMIFRGYLHFHSISHN